MPLVTAIKVGAAKRLHALALLGCFGISGPAFAEDIEPSTITPPAPPADTPPPSPPPPPLPSTPEAATAPEATPPPPSPEQSAPPAPVPTYFAPQPQGAYYAPQPQGPAPAPTLYWTAPPPPAPVKGRHEHDGFFLHFALGGGYSFTNSDAGATVKGAAITTELDMGTAISPRLSLHAGILANGNISPSIDSSANAQNDNSQASDRNFSLNGFTVGATYYTPVRNLFTSLRLGAGSFSMRNREVGQYYRGNLGAIARASAGKEWWVSDNWGLGLEFVVNYAYVGTSKQGGLRAMNGPMFGLSFSATYQ